MSDLVGALRMDATATSASRESRMVPSRLFNESPADESEASSRRRYYNDASRRLRLARRFAQDEMGAHGELGAPDVPADGLKQRIASQARQFRAQQPNRRERRLSILGHVDIVEADDGNVLRNAEPNLANAAQRTDRSQVIGGEHSRRRILPLQQP